MIVFFKKNQADGSVYFGCGQSSTCNLDGTVNGNPYFWSGDPPEFNKWYAAVGIIHGSGYSGADSGITGVYDCDTGEKVADGVEYKWKAAVAQQSLRALQYYSSDVTTRTWFASPRIEYITGNEPPLMSVVRRPPRITQGTAYPSGPRIGDLCTRTDLNGTYRYDGMDWVLVSESGADVTANSQIAAGIFRETFEDPNNNVATRWFCASGHSAEMSIQAGGAAGGKFVRIGNGGGNDERWATYYRSIPFDPSKLYRMRVRIRRTAGTGKCYIGVVGRDQADSSSVGPDSNGAHWIIASNVQPDGPGWTEYTGYFKGNAADAGDNSVHADPSNPARLQSTARYFRPIVLVNYTDQAGQYDIDEVAVDALPENADLIPEGTNNKWAAEHGATVGATWGVNITNQPASLRQIFYAAGAPGSGMTTGDIWIDSDDNKIYRYNGSAWGEIQDDSIAQALANAADAQATADGKIRTFVQTTAPTADGVGDLWFDSDDNYKPYRWDGAQWAATPYDVATWSKIVGTGKPSDYADVTADNPIATFRDNFENPNNDFATRWTPTGSGEASIQAGGVAGGKVLRIGDNSGNDQLICTYFRKIPFDPDKLYRIKVRARRTAGTGTAYVGICGYDAAGALLNPTGNAAHWICVCARNLSSGWITYTGYFKGTSAAGESTEHATASDPATLKTGVAYWTPKFYVNYSGVAGTTEIDEIAVDIIPENADLIAESSTRKWAGESGATVGATWGVNITNQPVKLVQFFYQTGAPATGMNTGDYWVDTDAGNKLYRYDGATWVDVQDDDIAKAISDAATAQSTADGKVKTFIQTTAPIADGVGDLWFDSDDSYKPYRWDGAAWIAMPYDVATWSKVTGTGRPEDGATNDSAWRHGSDPTKINGSFIYAETITGGMIAANTIAADRLAVSTLSSITANMGTLTAGTITLSLGGTNRLQISTSGIRGSNDSGSTWYNIVSTSGGEVAINADRIKVGTLVADRIQATTIVGLKAVSYTPALADNYYEDQYDAPDTSENTVHTSNSAYLEVGSKVTGSVGAYYNGSIFAGSFIMTVKLYRGSGTLVTSWSASKSCSSPNTTWTMTSITHDVTIADNYYFVVTAWQTTNNGLVYFQYKWNVNMSNYTKEQIIKE